MSTLTGRGVEELNKQRGKTDQKEGDAGGKSEGPKKKSGKEA